MNALLPKRKTATKVEAAASAQSPTTSSCDAGDRAISKALRVLERRMRARGPVLTDPAAVRDFLRLRLACLEHEVFLALFLDSQNRLIADDELFRGTIAQTS